MEKIRPPRDRQDFRAFIRRMTDEYLRRLNLKNSSETSQNGRSTSKRIAANSFLKRNCYEVGRRVLRYNLFNDLSLHVSKQARKHRGAKSGFVNRNDNVFVWVLRLVAIRQAKRNEVEINRKTMSKYAHQLNYALLHDIDTDWLIEFLKIAGSDQQISDRLRTQTKLDIPHSWTKPKSEK